MEQQKLQPKCKYAVIAQIVLADPAGKLCPVFFTKGEPGARNRLRSATFGIDTIAEHLAPWRLRTLDSCNKQADPHIA